MELSRNEVVALYNAMKDMELFGMSNECKKAFVVNAIKLKPIAEKIKEENTEVAEKFKTDAYVSALDKYMVAKKKADQLKTPEAFEVLSQAAKEFEPLFKEMEENFSNATAEFEQKFIIDLLNIPMNDFFEFMDMKHSSGYTFNDIVVFEKLLK